MELSKQYRSSRLRRHQLLLGWLYLWHSDPVVAAVQTRYLGAFRPVIPLPTNAVTLAAWRVQFVAGGGYLARLNRAGKRNRSLHRISTKQAPSR
jgi:hypothetical protein